MTEPEFYPNADAPPIHGPNCTQIGDECVGWHCPYCGKPSSSQGHTMCLERKRVITNRENATI